MNRRDFLKRAGAVLAVGTGVPIFQQHNLLPWCAGREVTIALDSRTIQGIMKADLGRGKTSKSIGRLDKPLVPLPESQRLFTSLPRTLTVWDDAGGCCLGKYRR
jgi:hypothetical protein